jgi:centriolar protein POC1
MNWVRACQISPDGRLALSCGDDRTARVWDLQSHK